MREAVIAQSRGECDTPMPMHLDLSSGGGGEVHIKSSYRRGGPRYALKVAGTYATRPYGSIVLVSAENGETLAYFDDGGWLTDLRTAAVSAMAARELGRRDEALGILGTGVQARLQAELHAEVLPLRSVWIWGRDAGRAGRCARDVGVRPARREGLGRRIARRGRRLGAADRHGDGVARAAALRAGTCGRARTSPRSAPTRRASRSSTRTCCGRPRSSSSTRAPSASGSASSSTRSPRPDARSSSGRSANAGRLPYDRAGITVADFTGLGAEDLFIAEACLSRISG